MLRLANTVGAGQERVVSRLARRAADGRALEVSHPVLRSFLPADHVARVFLGAPGPGTFIVGSESVELMSIAEHLVDSVGPGRSAGRRRRRGVRGRHARQRWATARHRRRGRPPGQLRRRAHDRVGLARTGGRTLVDVDRRRREVDPGSGRGADPSSGRGGGSTSLRQPRCRHEPTAVGAVERRGEARQPVVDRARGTTHQGAGHRRGPPAARHHQRHRRPADHVWRGVWSRSTRPGGRPAVVHVPGHRRGGRAAGLPDPLRRRRPGPLDDGPGVPDRGARTR